MRLERDLSGTVSKLGQTMRSCLKKHGNVDFTSI